MALRSTLNRLRQLDTSLHLCFSLVIAGLDKISYGDTTMSKHAMYSTYATERSAPNFAFCP